MKKQLLWVFFLFFAVAFLSAQDAASAGHKILKAAEDAILVYFDRYNPTVETQGNKVHGEAQYGKYKVKIEVTLSGDSYNIEIDSKIRYKYIWKWTENLKKLIAKRLKS